MPTTQLSPEWNDKLERLTAQKDLLGSFDSLVRGARTNTSGLSNIAQRIITLWDRQPSTSLLIESDRAVFASVELYGSDEDGRWILPLFMSGVREISLTRTASVDDVLRFTYEIANLELSEDGLDGFRDWLWSDGAEGWKIDSQMSFTEVFEEGSGRELHGTHESFGAVRASAMLSMDPDALAMIPSAELDRASLLPEFQTSLDLFAVGARKRAFDVPLGDVLALRESADMSEMWIESELAVVLKHRALHGAISPSRAARKLIAGLRDSPGATLTKMLTEIFSSDEPYLARIGRELIKEDLPRHLVLVDFDDASQRQDVFAILESIEPEQRQSFWFSVFRAHARERSRALTSLLASARPDAAFEELDFRRLPQDIARALGATLAPSAELSGLFATMLDGVEDEVRADLLANLPLEHVPDARERILELSSGGAANVVRALVPSLLEGDMFTSLELGAIALESTEPWPPSVMRKLMTAVSREDRDGVLLTRFLKHRRWSARVRLEALEHLVDKEEATLRRATRWRPVELFDPPELVEKLKSVRARLKRGAKDTESAPQASRL